MQTLISVIVPVYNTEYYVQKAIESLLKQTFGRFELILVDDASDDSTPAILRTYSDERIVSLRNTANRGTSFSRNRALQLAQGKYICIADADDVSFADRLEKQSDYLETHPDTLACGCRYAVFGNDQPVAVPEEYEEIAAGLMEGCPVLNASLMIRTDTLRKLGGYDQRLSYAADYDLCCRLALEGKITNLPETLLRYREHDRQQSCTFRLEREFFLQSARRKYLLEQIRRVLPEAATMPGETEVALPEMGRIIHTYIRARKTGKPEIRQKADDLLEQLLNKNSSAWPVGLEKGLCGLGCGLIYLQENGYIQDAATKKLKEIDAAVTEIYPHLGDFSFFLGRLGVNHYLRRRNMQVPDPEK